MARTSAVDTIIKELEAEIAARKLEIETTLAFIARLRGPLVRRELKGKVTRPRVVPPTEKTAS